MRAVTLWNVVAIAIALLAVAITLLSARVSAQHDRDVDRERTVVVRCDARANEARDYMREIRGLDRLAAIIERAPESAFRAAALGDLDEDRRLAEQDHREWEADFPTLDPRKCP